MLPKKEAAARAGALMLFMGMSTLLWAEPHLRSIKVAIINPTDENRPAELFRFPVSLHCPEKSDPMSRRRHIAVISPWHQPGYSDCGADPGGRPGNQRRPSSKLKLIGKRHYLRLASTTPPASHCSPAEASSSSCRARKMVSPANNHPARTFSPITMYRSRVVAGPPAVKCSDCRP